MKESGYRKTKIEQLPAKHKDIRILVADTLGYICTHHVSTYEVDLFRGASRIVSQNKKSKRRKFVEKSILNKLLDENTIKIAVKNQVLLDNLLALLQIRLEKHFTSV
jgi:hypothetical protein